MREMLRRVAHRQADERAFAQYWNESTCSFPRGAQRMRWLVDKEQARADAVFGREARLAAAALPPALLDETGVPLYAHGWDQDAGSLDAYGCLVAPLR